MSIYIYIDESGMLFNKKRYQNYTAVVFTNLGSLSNFKMETGNIENNDNYCRTLLWKRLQAAITGKWADQKEHEPLGGGFKFTNLDKQINTSAILAMERAELIDTIIASRIDKIN